MKKTTEGYTSSMITVQRNNTLENPKPNQRTQSTHEQDSSITLAFAVQKSKISKDIENH